MTAKKIANPFFPRLPEDPKAVAEFMVGIGMLRLQDAGWEPVDPLTFETPKSRGGPLPWEGWPLGSPEGPDD